MAAACGTCHSSAEYVLKTAQRLARSTATKRQLEMGEDGLYRAQKRSHGGHLKVIQSAPRVPVGLRVC